MWKCWATCSPTGGRPSWRRDNAALRKTVGLCQAKHLPLLRAKSRAVPGCALYARLRAGVTREVARRAGGRDTPGHGEGLPLSHLR